jgi:hypothetical protein
MNTGTVVIAFIEQTSTPHVVISTILSPHPPSRAEIDSVTIGGD